MSIISMIIILLFMMMTLILTLSMKHSPDREKFSMYECGFTSTSMARLPLSIRFFMLTMLFLIFDIELVLLLPAPLAISLNISSLIIFNISIFFLILFLGLMHEWNESSLEWI